jgi:transcriptional regulator with XRE-family HTH domain
MAHSTRIREYLKGRTLPPSDEVISEARDYMARAGLTLVQFAHRLGYAPSSVNNWLNGRYAHVASHDLMLRARFLDFKAVNPLDVPDNESEGKLYLSAAVEALRDDFFRALDDSMIIVRHGNPGTKKSYVSQYLIAELNRNEAPKNGHGRRAFRIYCGLRETPLGLMRRVAKACAVPQGSRVADIISGLQFDYRHRRVLLVFDEAQHLTEDCLEVVRELNDEAPHFGLLFLGSHDLCEKFAGFHMEQLRSRLHILKSLPGMTRKEASVPVREELPWLDAESIAAFVEGCVVSDKQSLAKEARVRGSKEAIEYVNARDLFRNIAETKRRYQAKKKKAGVA